MKARRLWLVSLNFGGGWGAGGGKVGGEGDGVGEDQCPGKAIWCHKHGPDVAQTRPMKVAGVLWSGCLSPGVA